VIIKNVIVTHCDTQTIHGLISITA